VSADTQKEPEEKDADRRTQAAACAQVTIWRARKPENMGNYCVRVRLAPYVHDRHRFDHGVRDYCWRCAMTGADRVIRWSTAGAVADTAAVASCEHAYALVRPHGEIMMSEPAPFSRAGSAGVRLMR
jgi:hypothetical protein